MSFLSRQLSFNQLQSQQVSSSNKNTGKPLPQLPPFEPIENSQSSRKQRLLPPVESLPHKAHAGLSTGLIRRVSSIFRSSAAKRKPSCTRFTQTTLELDGGGASADTSPSRSARYPPSAFDAYTYTSSTAGCSSDESYNDSLDDIRRPSGLGSAASFSSHRSMPLTPTAYACPVFPQEELGSGVVESLPPPPRSRAISSPNLLRSLSSRVKNKRKANRASVSHVGPPSDSPVPATPPLPPSVPHRRTLVLPVEVVEIVFEHVPRNQVPSLARLSRSFSSAARTTLYTNIDLQGLAVPQIEKLLGVLASRRDLTDIVQHFSCTEWPAFFNAGRHSTAVPAAASTPDRETQLRNTLLMATFTLALQRMANLTHLTLPSFDFSLLSQHSAFGLRNITFLNYSLPPEEIANLLTWLDGQINIAVLSFPNLDDQINKSTDILSVLSSSDYSPSPVSTPISASISASTPSTPVYYLQTPVPSQQGSFPTTPFTYSNPYLKVSPMSSPGPSPHAPSFFLNVPQAGVSSVSLAPPTTAFDPSTLLPNITTLHATPALLTYLLPPPSSKSSATSDTCTTGHPPTSRPHPTNALGRPLLHKVTLNINTNLYDGLRPSAVMSCLRGVRRLEVRFLERVDRRTVEKVLTAVSKVLGSAGEERVGFGGEEEDEKFWEEDGQGEGKGGDGGEKGRSEAWRGLGMLGIVVKPSATTSRGVEETVHRTLQGTLSRYTNLQDIQLDCLSNPRSGTKPGPLSPLNISVANAKNRGTPGILLATPVSPPTQNLVYDVTRLSPSPNPSPVDFSNGLKVNTIEGYTKTRRTEGSNAKTSSTKDAGTMDHTFKFPAFPLPPASPALLPFPSAPPSPMIAALNSKYPHPSTAAASPLSSSSLGPLHKQGTKPVDHEMMKRLTTQEQTKIEAWVRLCPSLRVVSLFGVRWYNPLWLPALRG